MKEIKKGRSGSMTVEMAYIMPLFGMLFYICVIVIFYYHDKNIITGCAYETVVVASTKAREKDGISAEMVHALFRERVKGKCILFPDAWADAVVGEAQIDIQVLARNKSMKLLVRQSAEVTDPEKYIRDMQRLKTIGKGR